MGREIGRDRCLGKREMVEIKSVHQEKQSVPANEKLCNFFHFFPLFEYNKNNNNNSLL